MPIPVLPLLLACGPDAAKLLQQCATSECRQHTVESAWQDDPTRVVDTLRALPDPKERFALTLQLARRFADEGAEICRTLPAGSDDLKVCDARRLAPDRDDIARKTRREAISTRKAPGPARVGLPLPAAGTPPWASPDPDPVTDCADLRAVPCALDRAERGDAIGAGRACASGTTPRSPALYECLVKAAEARVHAGGMDAIGDAVLLCTHAGYPGPLAFGRALQVATPPAPPAHFRDREAIATAHAAAARLWAAAAGDEVLADAWVDRFWALWVQASFDALPDPGGAPTGDLLDLLPPEAAPHVRLSAALEVLTAHPPTGATDLELRVNEVRLALERRSPDPAEPVPRRAVAPAGRRPGWILDDPGEEDLPAVSVLSVARRTTSANPTVDTRLAVLEAAWQLDPTPPAAFFLAAVRDGEDVQVRWTGARLGAARDPAEAARLHDPDPRVEARLRGNDRPDPQEGR